MESSRKRHFRPNQSVKQKWVEPGVSGLLFTCNGNEKQAVREAYNVIEEALEKWKGLHSVEETEEDKVRKEEDSGSDEEDVADSVKRFCDQARSGENNLKRRKIRQRPTGANNCLFFVVDGVTSENVCIFVDFLVEMALREQCCRLLHRVWPVERTCQVDLVELDSEVSRLISRHFHPNDDGKWPTYSFEFKARNNDSLQKSDAQDMALLALKQLAPASRVCLDDPEIAVLVQSRLFAWSSATIASVTLDDQPQQRQRTSTAEIVTNVGEYATSSSSNGGGTIDRIRRRASTQPIYQSTHSSRQRLQRTRTNMEDSMDFIPSGISNDSPAVSCQNNYLLAQHLVSSQGVTAPSLVSSSSNILESTEFHDGVHANVVLANMSQFRDEKFMCDIEIEVEGIVFSAHRYVLAAAIPYFHSMFASEMIESRQSRITIQDIPASAFQQLLDFAYTSKVHINGDNVQQLLYAASILQMDTVCGACQRFLTQYLTTTNCLSIRQFAEQHNCVSLMSSVDDFAMEHFPELRVLPEFMRIPFGHLMDLLRSSDLKVNNEQEVFETVMCWVEDSIEERRNCLPELLALVRLPQLPIAYFLNKVKKHPLVMECVRCRDLVADAMSEMMRAQIGPGISNSESASFSPAIPAAVGCGSGGFHTGNANFQGVVADFSTTNQTCNPAPSFGVWANCRPRKSAAGVIFCVGGRGTSGDPFRSVEAYDWRRDRWFSISDMNIRRRHVGVVSAQGKLYAIGGHDGTNHLSSAECFDPATNMWHTVASMDTRRRGIAVGALEGAIYAVGGLDDTACFQTVERYDIESDKWSGVEQMNVQRGGVGVAAVGKYLFAVGGNDGTSSLDSCERYDPLLNKWKLVASMQHRRAGAGVTVLDGCLYAIGGFDDNAPLPSCERYNPEDNTWTLLSQMSCPRGGVGVASMGGRIYAIGGHDGVRYLNSVEAYDPATNQWSSVATISQCRAGAGVAWAECRVDTLLRPPSMALGKDSGCAPCVTGVAHCV